MTLKRKIAFNFSIAYSVLFALVMGIIYYASYDFRKEEYRERLMDKMDFTVQLIQSSENFDTGGDVEVQETEDELFHDEILIFSAQKKLLYSTVKDKEITWDPKLLKKLDQETQIHLSEKNSELLGEKVKIHDKAYYIFISAIDRTGQMKLDYLKYVLILVYCITTVFVWLFSYNFTKKMLSPLDDFSEQITEVTAHKLTTQLQENKSEDEISILARAFNTMMVRINDVFQSQKDFTASAAHEIRTPLARIAFQLENLSNKPNILPETRTTLQRVTKDIHQLSDLTGSLILLSKFDREHIRAIFVEERIDEIIFEAYETNLKSFPDLQMDFTIDENEGVDYDLTLKCVKPLIEIAFINLFKNAALYSKDPIVHVNIKENASDIVVSLANNGPTISEEEQHKVFEAFTRGENSLNITGSGLGLKIVQRILDYHRASINYTINSENYNIFTITFPKTLS